MLYEHSMTLDALRYVILDEVHYLADRFRGPVWEEVIIHLPQSVRIIGLSATVSNVEDFLPKWIESVRGDTTLVVSGKTARAVGTACACSGGRPHRTGTHRPVST